MGATNLIYFCVVYVCNEALEDHEANILWPYHAHFVEELGGEEVLYPYKELLANAKLQLLITKGGKGIMVEVHNTRDYESSRR